MRDYLTFKEQEELRKLSNENEAPINVTVSIWSKNTEYYLPLKKEDLPMLYDIAKRDHISIRVLLETLIDDYIKAKREEFV